MVRYAANGASPKYVFWVEMPAGATLDVTLHVKYMPLTPELRCAALSCLFLSNVFRISGGDAGGHRP